LFCCILIATTTLTTSRHIQNQEDKNGSREKNFPMMPIKQWWALRKKFRATLPGSVTPSYLATTLSISKDSGRSNILPALKKAGIVDEEGKPTERANRWRDDTQYATICNEIRQEVYPRELLDIASDASADKAQVESWFANVTTAGESAAKKMTSFYMMLIEADPSKGLEAVVAAPAKPIKWPPKKTKSPQPRSGSKEPLIEPKFHEEEPKSHLKPSIHLDIQIHISPQTTPEQIEQIFASMAKHLKGL
jgi:hypothetical protein